MFHLSKLPRWVTCNELSPRAKHASTRLKLALFASLFFPSSKRQVLDTTPWTLLKSKKIPGLKLKRTVASILPLLSYPHLSLGITLAIVELSLGLLPRLQRFRLPLFAPICFDLSLPLPLHAQHDVCHGCRASYTTSRTSSQSG